ncbi:hypothetical protein B0H14DRAFT_3878701 [Mycena olivaceomarginata]|nr:hypothetical protein B0H14DRAFT_3878701 [Mycena olivaceomarginata]
MRTRTNGPQHDLHARSPASACGSKSCHVVARPGAGLPAALQGRVRNPSLPPHQQRPSAPPPAPPAPLALAAALQGRVQHPSLPTDNAPHTPLPALHQALRLPHRHFPRASMRTHFCARPRTSRRQYHDRPPGSRRTSAAAQHPIWMRPQTLSSRSCSNASSRPHHPPPQMLASGDCTPFASVARRSATQPDDDPITPTQRTARPLLLGWWRGAPTPAAHPIFTSSPPRAAQPYPRPLTHNQIEVSKCRVGVRLRT